MPFAVGLLVDSVSPGAIGILTTGLFLGFRHGFDWDHLAAITDITSTNATGDVAETEHDVQHAHAAASHMHAHGGPSEVAAHPLTHAGGPPVAAVDERRPRFAVEQRHAVMLGSLYALGHASVVLALGLLALWFGTLLPEWVDPIMSRVVGVTLLVLGVWVFISLYRYFRHGTEFRLRSRWMLVFDGIRYSGRRVGARIHGHEHAEPMEMSSYGRGTSFGVGMIHGIGAETGTQALLIASVGGAAGAGLGVPMLLAFICGLLVSNTLIVVMTATGFIAGRAKTPIYLTIGFLAGTFSVVVGAVFLLGADTVLPDLQTILFGS